MHSHTVIYISISLWSSKIRDCFATFSSRHADATVIAYFTNCITELLRRKVLTATVSVFSVFGLTNKETEGAFICTFSANFISPLTAPKSSLSLSSSTVRLLLQLSVCFISPISFSLRACLARLSCCNETARLIICRVPLWCHRLVWWQGASGERRQRINLFAFPRAFGFSAAGLSCIFQRKCFINSIAI